MFKHVAVLGAGTMGAGIAEVFARAQVVVYLYDVNDTVLRQAREKIRAGLKNAVQKGKLTENELLGIVDRIRPKTHLPDISPAEFVVEAVLEDLRVKKDLLRRTEEIVKQGTILASNTSSLSLTAIASGLRDATHLVGMHFFNPAPAMKLVEVVRAAKTSQTTVDKTVACASFLGKSPVVVQDTPGFIVNRVARPFYGEALRIVGERLAGVSQVDRILTEIGGFKMGPFELMDLIGIDVNLAVTQSMYDQYFGEPRYKPHVIQKRMVESGRLGRKSNEGFYRYDEFKKTKIEEER